MRRAVPFGTSPLFPTLELHGPRLKSRYVKKVTRGQPKVRWQDHTPDMFLLMLNEATMSADPKLEQAILDSPVREDALLAMQGQMLNAYEAAWETHSYSLHSYLDFGTWVLAPSSDEDWPFSFRSVIRNVYGLCPISFEKALALLVLRCRSEESTRGDACRILVRKYKKVLFELIESSSFV
ncbi:hypothetical protein ACP3V3_02150 [Vibrio sp. PNB22_3_1]